MVMISARSSKRILWMMWRLMIEMKVFGEELLYTLKKFKQFL